MFNKERSKIWRKYFVIFLSIFFIEKCFAAKATAILTGKYIQVGHNLIYTVSFGEGPNVIFASGLGASLENWKYVAPSIAEHAHVILYDRPGTGKSSAHPHAEKARTAQDAVIELFSLLKQLHVHPPYILVGHSLGGLYLQLFAREYPEMVSGIVLVDSVSPYQKMHDVLPDKSVSYYPEALGVRISENEVRDAKPFPNIQLIVLSATIHGPINGILNSKSNKEHWAKLQKDLSAMSTNSQHVIANNSGHCIQLEKPWLVIAAINEIIAPSKMSPGCTY
jgi:pimeloyl-ACP methyl ester carboxylesterase